MSGSEDSQTDLAKRIIQWMAGIAAVLICGFSGWASLAIVALQADTAVIQADVRVLKERPATPSADYRALQDARFDAVRTELLRLSASVDDLVDELRQLRQQPEGRQ